MKWILEFQVIIFIFDGVVFFWKDAKSNNKIQQNNFNV